MISGYFRFIDYADEDKEAAKILFLTQRNDYDFMKQGAFLCAQAAEKYLKAFLYWTWEKNNQNLNKNQILRNRKLILRNLKKLNHDLEKILEECIRKENSFKNLTHNVNKIKKFSLLRYPDIEEKFLFSKEGLLIDSRLSKDAEIIGGFVKELIGN